jgi:hypothetical protein
MTLMVFRFDMTELGMVIWCYFGYNLGWTFDILYN